MPLIRCLRSSFLTRTETFSRAPSFLSALGLDKVRSRSLVNLSVDESSGIGTITMANPPVNSLSLEFMEKFVSALETSHKDPKCKGLILTSGVPRIFSGGLDILAMYKPVEEKARKFWHTFQHLWMELYLSPIPVVAAINGAAPAGGTILACACDCRVVADDEKLRMGLNETQLGIVAPWWAAKMFVLTVGHREAEKALQLGHLYSPSEALSTGLVDFSVPAAQVGPKAEELAKAFMSIDPTARFKTKNLLRRPLVDELLAFDRNKDIDLFYKIISAPGTQKVMGLYLASLKAKSKK